MNKVQRKKDFYRHVSLAIRLLEKPMNQRTDEDYDEIVQLLKSFELFSQLSKIALNSELKDLVKQATIMQNQVGDIFKDHQFEKNTIYLFAFGSFQMLLPNMPPKEEMQQSINLDNHDFIWYLADQRRLRNTIIELLYQQFTVQCYKSPIINHNVSVEDNQDKNTSQPQQKLFKIKSLFAQDEVESRRPKVVLTSGDILISQFDQHQNNFNHLLYVKTTGIIIKLPSLGFEQLIVKIIQRFKNLAGEYLSTFPLFSEIQRFELQNLQNYMKILECNRNYYLFYQNQKINNIYILKEGEIELYQNTKNKIQKVYLKQKSPIAIITQNQLVLQEDFFKEQYHHYTAVVKSSTAVVICFQIEECRKLIQVDEDYKPQWKNVLQNQFSKFSKMKETFYRDRISVNQQTIMESAKNKLIQRKLRYNIPLLSGINEKYDVEPMDQLIKPKNIIMFSQQRKRRFQKDLDEEQQSIYNTLHDTIIQPSRKRSQRRQLDRLNISMENPLIMENVSENTKYIYNRSINAHYNEIGKAKQRCQIKSLDNSDRPYRIIETVNKVPKHLHKTLELLASKRNE